MAKKSEPFITGAKHFPIVALGASAGGLAAMSELLINLPGDTGMAYVYIQHLHPDSESALVPIFQRVSRMPVRQISELMPVEANHLFIIPPNKDVAIADGTFKLSDRNPPPARHSPIDVFFLSLAKKQKEGSIGIILSGTASDGALGLKAIKTAGGLTYVQDESARFQGMPKSAVAENAVDAILSPKELAEELVRLSKQRSFLKNINSADEDEQEIADTEDDIEMRSEAGSPEKENISAILKLIKKRTGVDFTHYKKNTISRRILRRMILRKFETSDEYIEYLKNKPDEIDSLYNDILINVTHFFRDTNSIEYLKKEVLPALLKNKSSGNPLRVWVPACSTGEEVYSLAMAFVDITGNNFQAARIQIFGTDLSEAAIAKAQTAVYTASEISELPREYVDRFFLKADGQYRLVKRIRDLCVFARHNVFKDPPFSRIDILSCCNLLIYFGVDLQKKVLANFHYALNKNGYLVLGKSETIGASTDLFSPLDKEVKIYLKKSNMPARAMHDVNYYLSALTRSETKSAEKSIIAREISIEGNLQYTVDNILLTQYTPAAVVINQHLDIIQFRGSTGLFLEPSPGKASFNLLKMARAGLEIELRNAVQMVIKTEEPIKKTDLTINHKGAIHYIGFEVTPLVTQSADKLLLIVFEEIKTHSSPDLKTTFSKDRRVKQLEAELAAIREDMRSITEDQEAANEELQYANEEIVSSNEELQSINEELETSKEELESSNEELLTINQEMQVRNEQLAEAHEYTEALIATIREAAIVLDSNLRIKSANTSFYNTFLIKEEEIQGRSFYELNDEQWNLPQLRQFLEDVIPRNNHFGAFELTHTFKGIGEKVLVLNGRQIVQKNNQQQFILLAIEDITNHRHANRLLEEREAWLRNMTDNVPVMIWVAGTDKNFIFLNKTWLAFTGKKMSAETGIGWTEDLHPADINLVLGKYHKSFEEKKTFTIEYRMKRFDGQYRWVLNTAVPTYDEDGKFNGYTGSCLDINDQRVNQELEKSVSERTQELQEANVSLERSNSDLSQFAYVASHDLQEPLRKIITFSNRLKEQFTDSVPEKAKEFIFKINRSAERMRNLIDDLLNFSRISRFDKKFIKTDLNKIVKDVLSDYDLLILEKKAVLHIDMLPVIEAIPLYMTQLFHNLIGNALKFTGNDADPVITINFSTLSENAIREYPNLDASLTYYKIVIKDNGIGFPAEFAEQIFVIFQRLSYNHDFPGTGIGLALCRKIVNNHHGYLYAESEEEDGAVFYVILPVQQPHESDWE